MSIKDEIAAGPKWVAHIGGIPVDQAVDTNRLRTLTEQRCGCCMEFGGTDMTTGLCRPCWRAWRWSDYGVDFARERRVRAALGETPPEV